MTYINVCLLYFCTVVCCLLLVSGGYKIIRNYFRNKIDAAAEEKGDASN
ncbi:DUF1378 family protein [Escherichia coli]|nr:DUF1378 family protein [Escherichia coli]AUL87008.1 DUF1378 domain-containing protein [Escherichia coli]AUL87969.1 DUF1378 domain-containing protein [Escherichia coli]AUL88333.1 DUF1378 domain-containing protein [Escherichia coli]